MPRLDRLWYEIDAQTRGFDEGILQSRSKLASFTEYAAGHPIAVLGALGVAATLAGVKLAAMASDFEKQMAMVNTVLDPTQANLKDLTRGLLDLNAALPIESVKELTKGLYDIVSSGIPAGEAIEFLGVASKAAVAGVTSVATTVDGLTTAVNAFKGQSLGVTRASDVMFQAVNKGKITFDELSHAMGLGAAVASGMGIKFEDLNAAVAQLSLGGMDARMAMVGVRSAIVNIIKPQEDFIKTFPQIAAEFNRAKLGAVGFTGFLTQLVAAAKGNSEVFVKLFNDIQGFNAVMALTKDGGKALNQMLVDVSNSAGATDTAFGKMANTTSATNQILKNQLNNELIQLGTVLLPAVNLMLETTTFWVEKLGKAVGGTRLSDLVVDLRAISFTQTKAGPSFFGTDVQATRRSFEEFIDGVRKGRFELSQLSKTELTEVRAGMMRMSQTFPNWPGYGEAIGKVNEALAANIAASGKAAVAQTQINRQATAGAVAFVESNAKSVAELNKNVSALGRGETAATQYGISMQKLRAANREAQDALAAARKADQEGNKAAAEEAQKAAGEALGKATAARQEARQALKEMGDATRADAAEQKRKLDQLESEAKARRDLHFAIEETLAKTTGTAVDDLSIALQKQVADFRARLAETKGMTPADQAKAASQIDEIEKANEAMLEMLRSSERVDTTLRRVDKAVLGLLSDTGNVDLFREINAQIDSLTGSLVGMDVNSAEFKNITADILKLEQAREKLHRFFLGLADKAVTAANAEAAAKERSRRHMEKMARDISTLARGALDVAQAFGLMNDETAQMLTNVIDIAANLPGAMTGDISSIGGVLKGIAGLFSSGEDPAVKAAREQNTRALVDLSRHIGDLSKAMVSGNQVEQARKFAEQYAKMYFSGYSAPGAPGYGLMQRSKLDPNLMAPVLAQLGLSMDELNEVAKSLGITLKTMGDVEKLLAAINMADLAAYTDTFAGQMSRLHDEFRAFGIEDPSEQLRRTIEFLTSSKGIPAISEALAGVDTSTAAGASDAITRLQDLFTALADGTITAAQLGGASVDETRQAILDLIDQLRGAGGGTTGAIGYAATITEATGSHIAGMLAAGNTFASRTADATETMSKILGAMTGLTSVIAPALPSGLGAPQFNIYVTVAGVTDPVTAQRVGTDVGKAAIDTINQGLATSLRRSKRAVGNVIVS